MSNATVSTSEVAALRSTPTLADLGRRTRTSYAPAAGGVGAVLSSLVDRVRPTASGQITALRWSATDPEVADDLCLVATIVRVWAVAGRLLVEQELSLQTPAGSVAARGAATWQGGPVPEQTAVVLGRADVGTLPWAEHVRRRLDADTAFADAVRTFDGSIEVVAGDRAVQFRVYRGAIVEVAGKTPNGPTFSVVGSDRAWTDFRVAGREDFIARVSAGEFTSRGSSFEYLRVFKAVALLSAHASTAWREDRDALRAIP